jgi:hypothetical protein
MLISWRGGKMKIVKNPKKYKENVTNYSILKVESYNETLRAFLKVNI